MAGLRKGHSYTKVKRAYTRRSKFKSKEYIKAIPNSKLVRYDMGDVRKQYPYRLDLVSKQAIQLRHNSLESSRQVVNRMLNKYLGNNYYLKMRVYPHHVLRENKMITGAGADRMSTGMQLAFGRAVGIAARVQKGQSIISAKVNAEHIEIAKKALRRARPRLPGQYTVVITKLEAPKVTVA